MGRAIDDVRRQWRGSHAARRAVPAAAPRLAACVVGLREPEATDTHLTGAKAANLAVAARAGMPVLPGFAITTRTCGQLEGSIRSIADPALEALRAAWCALTDDGREPVVARSSSTIEDDAESSMAGRFRSVLGLRGWDAFLDGVDEVLSSADLVSLETMSRTRAPMAVLVQLHLDATVGAIAFGADPVTGDVRRVVLDAAGDGPDALVSGAVTGTRYTLSRRGRVANRVGEQVPGLDRRALRRIASLSRRAAAEFGSPQDNEIALDAAGAVWLLQSRPVTALGDRPVGPLLGPGPVAETFPDRLLPLEEDLWLQPLRRGATQAIRLSGMVGRRRLDASPVITSINGWAAADLEVFGAHPRARPLWARIDPRPPARRLRAAWRTGRLRAALPALAGDVLAAADAELTGVRAVGQLSDVSLLHLLRGSRQSLTALHGHEILVGMLLAPDARASTGAAIALRALAAARAQGLDDAEIVAQHPVVLALVPPSIRPLTLPPPQIALTVPPPSPVGDPAAELREQLRLRARWMQELAGRAAWEVGRRLADRGAITETGAVRLLRLEEVEACLIGGARPPALDERRRPRVHPPLPAVFRLTASGAVVAADPGHPDGGRAGGGGRGAGTVVHAATVHGTGVGLPEGSVLVTRTLDPSMATLLPGLAGLVAETGSALSHLAILARELGVPTVVAVSEALERFPEGTALVVDGDAGTVSPASQLVERKA